MKSKAPPGVCKNLKSLEEDVSDVLEEKGRAQQTGEGSQEALSTMD